MNVVERFRSLPQSTRRLLSLGMILALVVALPLFIWALINGNFNPNKKAASGELEITSSPTPTPTAISSPTASPSGNLSFCNGTCGSNLDCQSGLGCYQGSCRNPSCVSSPNCTCGLGTSTPTPTPPPTSRPFNILLKLDGVSDGSAHLANVTVRFISKSLNNLLGYITPPLPIVYVGNGVYRLPFGIWSAELPAASDYAIVVKGEKHLSTKFCVASGQTQHCSGSTVGQINIPSTPSTLVSLDFTGIPLEPGDLYVQDGVVDASDFNKIKALLVKPCASLTDQDKLTGDVDYNGCVNAKDAFLIRQTLETRYDEN